MKILLLGFNVQQDVFPLGLAYLKAYTQKYYPQVEIILKEFSFGNRMSYETNKNLELQALSYILLQQPDVVAFSCYIWSGEMAIHFAQAIKKLAPQIKVVLGGVEVSEKLMFGSIDFIITGEGEIAFKELVDYWQGKKKLSDVRNVVYFNNGKLIRNPIQELDDLDELPFPYRVEGLNTTYAVVRVETARGCVYNCAFCHYAQPTLRYFSLEYLRENLRYLFQHFTFQNLTFLDANFNTNKERMLAILDVVEDLSRGTGRENLQVHCELRPELLDEQVVQRLQAYSFRLSVELGLQSTDAEVLKAVNRPTNMEKVKRALELLDGSSIKYKIDLMYGLPRDTFFKFCTSARFVLRQARKQNKVVAHHFMLLNNTELYPRENGVLQRLTPESSSMVILSGTQNALDLYYTKLFVDMLNEELKFY